MIVTFPAGVGVSSINVGRDRAEVSDINIGYFNTGLPITDGSIQPAQQPNNAYAIQSRANFDVHQGQLQLWTTGTWHWGGTPGQGMPRIDLTYFRDRAEVSFFTGAGDPFRNTYVQFFFTRRLGDVEVPDIREG